MSKNTHPTYTNLIFDLLVKVDDFRTMPQLAKETGCNHNQAGAALHSLQQYKAVNCVSAPEGLWWFATPQTDTRTKIIKEVAHYYHSKPRRAKKAVQGDKP